MDKFTAAFDKESFIISPNVFEVRKLLLEIPHFGKNEIASKQFIKKFY